MDALQSEVEELRGLSARKPTSARIAQIEKALSSKWEGTQSVALKTLGIWGGRPSVAIIRTFLEEAAKRKNGWAIRGVAINALVDLIALDDADWIYNLCHSPGSELKKWELRPLIEQLSAMGAHPAPQ